MFKMGVSVQVYNYGLVTRCEARVTFEMMSMLKPEARVADTTYDVMREWAATYSTGVNRLLDGRIKFRTAKSCVCATFRSPNSATNSVSNQNLLITGLMRTIG
jgi:hypothetical protein